MVMRRVLRDKGGSASIFARRRERLHHAQQQKQKRGSHADDGIAGKQPIRKVAPLISKMDTESAHLRPFLSPMLPQKIAPMGRTRNESANTPKVLITATARSSAGKNTMAITVAK